MPRTHILEIPLLKLDWPSNVRQIFEPDGIASLAKTMKSHGLQQHIGVYQKDDRYVGIYGQRRSMAAKLAAFTTISAMVWPAEPTAAELSELQLIENTQREDLRPTEHAAALAKYMSASGMNAAEIAERAVEAEAGERDGCPGEEGEDGGAEAVFGERVAEMIFERGDAEDRARGL